MAFCKGGLAVVRKLYNEIDTPLENAMDKIVDFTGKVKALETNPTVEAITSLVPKASDVEQWLNTAIDKIIIPVAGEIKTGAEKLSSWLNNKTDYEKNGNLLKLASVMTATADDHKNEEHFYDSAVQLQVISNK